MVKKIFWAAVAAYIVFLIMINAHEVPFSYVYGEKINLKLDLVIVLSFAAGMLAVFINNFISKSQQFFSKVISYPSNKKMKKLDSSFSEALKYFNSDNFVKAKEILTEYVKENTQNIDAYIYLSDIYLKEDRVVKAEETLKQASTSNKYDVRIMTKLADIYAQSKKYDKALKLLDEIIKKEDDKGIYLKKSYDIYITLKNYKKAADIKSELMRDDFYKGLEKEFLSTDYNLALTLVEEGKYGKANKLFNDIMAADKRFYGAYVSYAEALIKKGDQAEALTFLAESYENTKFPVFAKMIEDIYITQEKPQKALLFYQNQIDEIAIGARSSDATQSWMDYQALVTYALFVSLLFRLEMIDYAVETIENIVGTDDDKRLFHFFLAECFLKHDKFEAAAMQYHEYLKSRRLHPMLLKCSVCNTKYDEFKAQCDSCGTLNKINYYIK